MPGIGGMGRGDDYLWAGLKGTPNHPDRLLVGGLLGPRRGGVGRTTGRAPERLRMARRTASKGQSRRFWGALP